MLRFFKDWTGLAQGDRVTSATGCASASDKRACLRALAPAQLMTAVPPVVDPAGMNDGESFGPILDGSALTEAPGRAIANGTAAPVPPSARRCSRRRPTRRRW